jgi:hypothetical protein
VTDNDRILICAMSERIADLAFENAALRKDYDCLAVAVGDLMNWRDARIQRLTEPAREANVVPFSPSRFAPNHEVVASLNALHKRLAS